MSIDDVEIDLGLDPFANSQEEAKDRIVEILKRDYNLDYDKNDIKFEWGWTFIMFHSIEYAHQQSVIKQNCMKQIVELK